MKDKINGKIIREFVGLKSKIYSIKIEDQKLLEKAKGVKSSVFKTTLYFDDYVKCFHENVIMNRDRWNIRSRLHEVLTEKEIKIELSARDDKRYLLTSSTNTLLWGHHSINRGEIAVNQEAAQIDESNQQQQRVGETNQ